ncbi:unnamed protein product [Prorocentrum cordatum]|uniref:Uncharacterized protein n=1 Tax=Prorocentrum cordatum TaxID=2364126 RepID=A0ABN9UMF5_9DINO|nr:unnamed protein product [Polarella glacialis]
MASTPQALELVAPRVEAVASAVNSEEGSPSQLMAKGEAIIRLLKDPNLACDRTITPRLIRPHITNRSGAGLDPFDAHCLIDKILARGCVQSKTAMSCRFEAHPIKSEAFGFNEKLWHNSDGMLAPVQKEDLNFLSVGGSHTVGGMNAVESRCATFLTDTAEDGHLSIDKCTAKSPEYADAVLNGFPWRAIRYQVDERFPLLAQALVECLNSGHNTERTAAKIQILLEVFTKGKQNLASHGEFKWAAVPRAAEASEAHVKGQVLDMTAFVERWSGGDSGSCLRELDAWPKTLRSRAGVQGSTFKMLAGLEIDRMPEAVFAMLKAAMVSPSKYCHTGTTTSKLLNSTDVAAMLKDRRQQLVQIVGMVRAAHEWYADMLDAKVHLSNSMFLKLPGSFEVGCVMLLLKKPLPGKQLPPSLQHIGQEFVDKVTDAVPFVNKVKPPWAPMAQTGPVAKGSCVGFRNVAAGGPTAAFVASAGFELGAEIELKTKPLSAEFTKWTIASIGSDMNTFVELKGESEDGSVSSNVEKVDVMSLVDLHKALSSAKDALHFAFRAESTDVAVVIHHEVLPSAKTEVEQVVAQHKYEKGKLILVPLSTACCACAKLRVPPNAVEFPVVQGMPDGVVAYVAPTQVWPHVAAASGGKKRAFIAPYWAVPAGAADHNMINSVVKVDIVDKYVGSGASEEKGQSPSKQAKGSAAPTPKTARK